MARFLVAATSIPGHVFPLLAVCQHLVSRGHEVVVHTGSVFRDRAEATGARFVAFRPEIDIDYRRLDDHFPERSKVTPGPAQLCFGLKHFVADAIPYQSAGIRDIRREFPMDAIIVDAMFCGAVPLLLGPSEERTPIVALGIAPLALSSADTAFFGTALPPARTPQERAQCCDEQPSTTSDLRLHAAILQRHPREARLAASAGISFRQHDLAA
jgi:hypothetical protein